MDFVKWCLDQGLGGLVLLALIGFIALLIVMGVLLTLVRLLGFAGDLGGTFVEGFREGRDKPPT